MSEVGRSGLSLEVVRSVLRPRERLIEIEEVLVGSPNGELMPESSEGAAIVARGRRAGAVRLACVVAR